AAMPFDDAKAIMTGEGWERTGRTLSHAVRPISGGHLRKERLNCCQAAPTFTCDAVTLPYCVRAHGRRGSQVVRHGSAKAAFVGSIPTLASIPNCVSSQGVRGNGASKGTKTDTRTTATGLQSTS